MTSTQAAPGLIPLAAALSAAKLAEDAAIAARVAVEEQIIVFLDFKKPEGQETFDAESGAGSVTRIIVKQPINTKFNGNGWPSLRKKLKPEARKAVRSVYEIDTKAARQVQTEDPASWKLISALVTRKPGKIGVSLEQLVIVDGENLAALEGDTTKPIKEPA